LANDPDPGSYVRRWLGAANRRRNALLAGFELELLFISIA
jgi:hypothetical protein